MGVAAGAGGVGPAQIAKFVDVETVLAARLEPFEMALNDERAALFVKIDLTQSPGLRSFALVGRLDDRYRLVLSQGGREQQ